MSIIIPHYGSAGLTRACLDAVAATVPGVQVVVVDNGTGDRFDVDVFIPNPTNVGFGAACNQGAYWAAGDILVFLNNDTEPKPGWLAPLISRVAGGAAIVGSKLVYPDGRIQHAGVWLERDGDGVLVARNYQEARPAGPVEAVTGACLAIRRDVFIKLGGFDDGYLNGYEDVDLCLTARDAGLEVFYEPASVVMHHESASGPARWVAVRANIDRLQERWEHYGRN